MEAANDRDFDAAMSVFAADATFDVTSAGLGVFRGVQAIRAYLEDWVGAYQQQRFSEWNGEDLGGGVVLAVVAFDARLPDSTANVRERWAFTCRLQQGQIASVKADGDLERARAQAALLAADASAGAA
jgi:ketosteroid isomerase-like protein